MPQFSGSKLSQTQITGGQILTTATGADGKETDVSLSSAAQYHAPDTPYATVSASDGSQWYQLAAGDGMGSYYAAPTFTGDVLESAQVASTFPGAEPGTFLRTIDDGVVEATSAHGSSLWYNSAHYEEPGAPHDTLAAANGVQWYAMHPHADVPQFEQSDLASSYNQAQFQQFLPGFSQGVTQIDPSRKDEGYLEVRHQDGSGAAFYDRTQYQPPRGDYRVYEDVNGEQWYAIQGTPALERRPVFVDGQPQYDERGVMSTNVEAVKYHATLSRFGEPAKRDLRDGKQPKRK